MRFRDIISEEDQYECAKAGAIISYYTTLVAVVITALPEYMDARWEVPQTL